MKIARHIKIITLIAMIFCAFGETCFAQETVAQAPVKVLKNTKKAGDTLNSEKVLRAYAKQKAFWVVGGFWGFLVWILMFLNAIMFCISAISSWVFIRRHRAYPRELVHKVKNVLYNDSLGFAMEACSPCKTPLGRILYSAFKNIADGFEICRDEMNIAIKAEHARMRKATYLLLNCAIYSVLLGFLGTGMVLFKALRNFSANTEMSNWQELAYSCSQSFNPLIAGLILAFIAFWFYKYCLGKIDRIIINTEKIAYDLIKILRGINLEEELPDIPTMTRLLNPSSVISLSKDKIKEQ